MKNLKIYALFALLLMAGNMTMQAQDTIGYSTGLFAAKSGKAVTHLQDFDPEYSEWLYYDNGNYYTNVAYTPVDIPFSWAVAYPNPGKDVLNIRTGLRNARVEVYDMSGRLMHSQALTENVTAIDAGGWPSEAYFWKVYTGVSTGLTTLVETGKWIKE